MRVINPQNEIHTKKPGLLKETGLTACLSA